MKMGKSVIFVKKSLKKIFERKSIGKLEIHCHYTEESRGAVHSYII